MHAIEFLRQGTSAKVRPIYAVSGDDAYLRREVITAIARSALGGEADDLAIVRFPGEQVSLADVFDELRTLPFLSRARVVIVEGADPFITAHRKELEEYAAKPAATGVLVLSVKSWPSNTKLAKAVEQVGLGIDCKTPAESELPTWLIQQAKARYGIKFETDAAQLLVELIGPEIALLAPEVDKLATYVGDRTAIRRADVSTMVGAGRVETIWKALEAAATGQPTEAITLLDRLIGDGEHPVGLLSAMSASLRKVHHAGQLRVAHRDLNEACREAGIPNFPAAIRATAEQHKHLGPARVDRLPEMLLRADLDLKGSSQLAPRVILERLVLWLARPRQDEVLA